MLNKAIFANFALMDDDLLTVEEVAEDCKVSTQTVRNWIKTGALPAIKLGREFRIKREDLNVMVASRRAEAAPLGAHRDPWAPETLGLPYRPRETTPRPSIWDSEASPTLAAKRS
jgi:excisionase family DNA binding protein